MRICTLMVVVASAVLAGSFPAAGAVGEERDGGLSAAVAAGGFSDAAEAGVHLEAVNSLAADGVFEGTECGPAEFCPWDAVERWVMAVWLVRILDGADPPAVGASRFVDVDASQWWAPYVERLAVLGCDRGLCHRAGPFLSCRDGYPCSDGVVPGSGIRYAWRPFGSVCRYRRECPRTQHQCLGRGWGNWGVHG